MRWMPTVQEEREIAVVPLLRSALHRGWLTTVERKATADHLAAGWQLARPIVRIVGFVIGAILVSALFSLLALMTTPAKGVVTAVFSIVAAELLIVRKRFWKSGIEEVLWIGGLFAIIFDLPGPPRNEGLLLFAFASLIAAVRLLQPWFAALFVGFVAFYVVTELERAVTGPAFVYAVGGFALLLLLRRWQMPLVEKALSIVAVLALPVAYILLRFVADLNDRVAIVAGAASVIVFLTAGMAIRHRAPLWGALLTSGIVLFDFATQLTLAPEWKWLIAGVTLVGLSQLTDRALRSREAGLTSRREPASDLYALAEVAAANAASVASRPQPEAPPSQRESGGGSFGGGGASGDY